MARLLQILRSTAQPLPGCGGNCGAGLVNAYAAVQASRVKGPCGHAPAGQLCTFDSLSHYVNSAGVFEETVVAYGRMWKFNFAGQLLGSPVEPQSVPYAPAGAACTFDTRELANVPGQGLLETITAYGRYWQFNEGGTARSGSGALLTSMPRFQ